MIETRKIDNVLSKGNGLSVLFIIIAIIFYGGDPDDGWAAVVGFPVLETAVMYFIIHILFIKEGDSA